MTKIAREASFLVVAAAFCAVNLYGLVHNHDWTQVLSAIGVSACAFGTIDHGMRLACAWRCRTLPAVHVDPTPDELRAPFMAEALAEVDDMKLGGPRLAPTRDWPAEPEWRSDAWRSPTRSTSPGSSPRKRYGIIVEQIAKANTLAPADPGIANQREPEASPSYPPRLAEAASLQGQILDGWRESYAKRTRYRL